jgi:N-acetylmuramoyl-L-alanine amidase
MKSTTRLAAIASLATTLIGSFITLAPAFGATLTPKTPVTKAPAPSVVTPKAPVLFGQKEVDQNKFIAISVPIARGKSQNLMILEQVSNQRACWKETGGTPATVDPLLLKFNFTGICGRATDSNGYSIRLAGKDVGMQYTLSLQKVNGDMVLVGTNRRNPFAQRLVIGHTGGITDGIMKINLEPGWRMTKRTYNGQTLGHIYFTNDSSEFAKL